MVRGTVDRNRRRPVVAPVRARRRRELVGWFVASAALVAAALAFLFPLWWMLTTSLTPFEEAVQVPPTWIPGL